MAGPATDPASKWLQAMQSGTASQNYTNGIQNYQGNPMQLAADQSARYLAGVQDAVSSQRYQQALMSTPVSVWKQNSIQKGASRLASGAQAALPKVQAHHQKFASVYANIKSTVAAMPKGGMANALARVQTSISLLKQAAGKPVG